MQCFLHAFVESDAHAHNIVAVFTDDTYRIPVLFQKVIVLNMLAEFLL